MLDENTKTSDQSISKKRIQLEWKLEAWPIVLKSQLTQLTWYWELAD